MLTRSIAAARLAVARGARMADAKGLERRRGLLSFLTWAFFLAEVFGHETPPAFAAHATQGEDEAPRHAADDTAPTGDHAGHAPLPISGEPEAAPDQLASQAHGALPGIGPVSVPDTGNVFPGDVSGTLPRPVFDLYGDGPGVFAHGHADDNSSIDSVGQHESPVSDGALTLEATLPTQSLLHTVSEPLGLVSAITDAVEDVAGSVLKTVSALSGGLGSLLSIEIGTSAPQASHNEAVASGGLLSFGPSTPAEAYEIDTSKGFTDFGINLSLAPSDGAPGMALSPLELPPLDLSVLGHDMDPTHAQSSSASTSDEFNHRSALDLLA